MQKQLNLAQKLNRKIKNIWMEIDSKLYCPDCIEYDEDIDDYKVKKE